MHGESHLITKKIPEYEPEPADKHGIYLVSWIHNGSKEVHELEVTATNPADAAWRAARASFNCVQPGEWYLLGVQTLAGPGQKRATDLESIARELFPKAYAAIDDDHPMADELIGQVKAEQHRRISGGAWTCICGYGPTTEKDIDEHITTMARMHTEKDHHARPVLGTKEAAQFMPPSERVIHNPEDFEPGGLLA